MRPPRFIWIPYPFDWILCGTALALLVIAGWLWAQID